MRSIQDVGTEIINKNPKSFYVFVGPEYGVKMKYVDMISEVYDNRIVNSTSVKSVLNLMKMKHIVPLPPSVYVIRYDDEFISSIGDSTFSEIRKAKIIGTIVCIYEDSKSTTKLDKYIPDLTVSVDNVNRRFINKYLHKDFHNIPDRFIDVVSNSCYDYNHGKLMCYSISFSNHEQLYEYNDEDIISLLGVSKLSTDKLIRQAIASRNFSACELMYSKFSGDTDSVFYSILSTLVELEKIKCNPRSESDIQKYAKFWSLEDIYNMFNQTYNILIRLRTDVQSSEICLFYLFSLLAFSKIPSLESTC